MTDTQTASGLFNISGYSIVREVGRGGIATVYLAVQESLQREVALKIMSPALTSDPNFTKRFLNEGLTIARLNHPGIVTIYDISVDGYQHYIAMEFLQGGNLKSRIGTGLSVDRVLDILYQIAAALNYAHQQGIVHRDVKPENIMFRDAAVDEAVLTDFGIAKTDKQQSNITRAGLVVGTPRYMSPEQAEGQDATERSDIYALGVIFHEMLTGRPPFEGGESLAVLYSHLHDPVPRLPDHHLALQQLFEDMMAKDPSARVPDCGTLLDRIEEHMTGPDSNGGEFTGTQSVRRPARKNKTVRKRMGTAALVLAWVGTMLAVGIVASSIFWEFTRTQDNVDSMDSEHSLPEGEPPEIVTPVKIDLTSVAGADPVDPIVAQPSEGNGIDTGALLKLAGQQFRQDRLSTPPDDNAMDTYNVILKMQPGNGEAERGLQKIAARYAELSRRKLDEQKLDEAEAFARSGLAAWPRHSGLLALQKEITQRSEAGRDSKEGYSESIQSYITAANAGNAPVQFQLALAFANGDGVARDAGQALNWFEKAARQGHVKAQYNLALGQLFGPSPDQINAGSWMKSAGDQEYKRLTG